MLADSSLDQLLQTAAEVFRLLKFICHLAQFLCDRRVEHNVRAGNRVGGTHHSELKLVAGKGKRGSSVSVRSVTGKQRQDVGSQPDSFLFRSGIGLILFNRLQDGCELVPEKDGYDCRRRFVGTQPVVVPGGGNGETQKILIIVHRFDHRYQEQQELRILMRRLAGGEQVHAGIRGNGPVIVFAAAVYPCKRLFMQQADHAVLPGYSLHNFHGELVVVGRPVGGCVNRRQFVL